MKYGGTLLAVKDMEKSKKFYEEVLDQVVVMDTGPNHPEGIRNVAFKSGVSLQAGYDKLVEESIDIQYGSNSFQLYFEVEDFDKWESKLNNSEVKFLHHRKEYPWGQNVLRIYDVEGNIIEIAESMVSVASRFLAQGLSSEEVAKRTMLPIDLIKSIK